MYTDPAGCVCEVRDATKEAHKGLKKYEINF